MLIWKRKKKTNIVDNIRSERYLNNVDIMSTMWLHRVALYSNIVLCASLFFSHLGKQEARRSNLKETNAPVVCAQNKSG